MMGAAEYGHLLIGPQEDRGTIEQRPREAARYVTDFIDDDVGARRRVADQWHHGFVRGVQPGSGHARPFAELARVVHIEELRLEGAPLERRTIRQWGWRKLRGRGERESHQCGGKLHTCL